MDEDFSESQEQRSIKSVGLQDLVSQRPHVFAVIRETGKTALMVWGAISLSAAVGYTALQLQGGPEESVLKNERPAIEQAAGEVKPPRLPVVAAAPKTATPTEEPEVEAALARLPKPRPDEPIITGSISPAAADPYQRRYAQNRYADPCEAWNSLGMPFRLRCIRESRAEPPYFPGYPQRW